MWRGALFETRQNPWLGVGPMNYACLGPDNRAGHPHSFPVQFAVEWGIPALILLAATALSILFKLFGYLHNANIRPDVPSKLSILVTTGILAAIVHSFLSGVLVMPASQVAGVLVAGWMMALIPGTSQRENKHFVGVTISATSLVVSLALVVFAQQQLANAEARFEQTDIMNKGIPRFWQNGKACKAPATTFSKISNR